MALEDYETLQQLSQRLNPNCLQSQLVMNEITPEDLFTLTSTLNEIIVKLFENPKFTSICEAEENMEAAAKKYELVFGKIVEVERELKAPKTKNKPPKTKTYVEHIDFGQTSKLMDKQKAQEFAILRNELLRQSKEAELLNCQLNFDLTKSKEELTVLRDKTNDLDNKVQNNHSTKTNYLEKCKETRGVKTSALAKLETTLSVLNDEKEVLSKEQWELENFMDEIEIEIKMKQDELLRMKASFENEQKMFSATKNNIAEMITAQQIGALNKYAMLTPMSQQMAFQQLRKEGDDVCFVAKVRSNYQVTDGKEQTFEVFPGMSSFSMRFSSIEQSSVDNQSSIGPCIKRITFSSTAKKPEFRASAENANETNHYILQGLSTEKVVESKKLDISEFTENQELDDSTSEIREKRRRQEDRLDERLKKEKQCLCSIY